MKNHPENTPVYLIVFSELRDQIVNGTLAPGEMIPSENELCSRYNTTRETVRKGLKQLEQDGLISSRPRKGYFVNYPHHDEFILSLPESIKQSAGRYKDIRIMSPGKELQEALQIPASQKIIALFRIDYTDTGIFGLEVKYLPYGKGMPSIEKELDFAVFPEAARAKSTSFSYYTELKVKAVTAPDDIRSMLECEEQEPLLMITKTFITQTGQRLAYSKQYLRAPYGELRGISGYVQEK